MFVSSSLLLAALAGASLTASDARLEVTVEGIAARTGHVAIGLYDTAQAWDADQSLHAETLAVESGRVTLSFEGLAPGEYGIKVFHDVDGDGALNRGAMGIPSEPYGFSNNARGQFGPARWSAAVFTVEAGENAHSVTVR